MIRAQFVDHQLGLVRESCQHNRGSTAGCLGRRPLDRDHIAARRRQCRQQSPLSRIALLLCLAGSGHAPDPCVPILAARGKARPIGVHVHRPQLLLLVLLLLVLLLLRAGTQPERLACLCVCVCARARARASVNRSVSWAALLATGVHHKRQGGEGDVAGLHWPPRVKMSLRHITPVTSPSLPRTHNKSREKWAAFSSNTTSPSPSRWPTRSSAYAFPLFAWIFYLWGLICLLFSCAQIKYGEIIELLLAAGYFRARIASLSPFDRVIGGLAWGLTNSAVDVDVDVVFVENSSIGQRMYVPSLSCPGSTRVCFFCLAPSRKRSFVLCRDSSARMRSSLTRYPPRCRLS